MFGNFIDEVREQNPSESLGASRIEFDPSVAAWYGRAAVTFRREQYLKAFPDSHPKVGKLQVQPAPIIIRHGAGLLTAWILWLGTLGLFLMQGYCVLLARHVQHNPWLAGLAIGAPVVAAFFLAPWIPRKYPNLYEQSFLFFAWNPVLLLTGLVVLIPMVQIFSERRFRELEIL